MTASSHAFAGFADRYAMALYELAEESKALDAVAGELTKISALMDESADLQRLIRSPVIGRAEQGRAMGVLLERMGVSDLTRRFVGVLAQNRRLFALPAVIASFQAQLAAARGEMTASVVSAQPLSDAQEKALAAAIKAAVGRSVALSTRVDPSLLGGLVVKVGSRMIDNSLGTKLGRLSLAMRGIG